MPRPLRFAHVVIQSYDMPRLAAWYRDVFDLDILVASPRVTFGTYDDEHHRFGFVQLAGEAPNDGRPSPLKHVAFAYAGLDDLVAQYRKLKAQGHLPAECVNHGPTLSFYYQDPDGNGVEFFIDRFATMEESKAYMLSEPFQKNLFGYFIDPEKIAEQFDAGVAHDEILAFDQKASEEFMRSRT